MPALKCGCPGIILAKSAKWEKGKCLDTSKLDEVRCPKHADSSRDDPEAFTSDDTADSPKIGSGRPREYSQKNRKYLVHRDTNASENLRQIYLSLACFPERRPARLSK